jgi:DNA replication protein DnaC
MARADGSLRNLLARLARIDVLVIDDWAMAPPSEPERRDFWEMCEDRGTSRFPAVFQKSTRLWHGPVRQRYLQR